MIHLIDRFTEHLKGGKYNQATIASYRNAVFVFYNSIRDMPQSKITDEFIGNYLVELGEKKDKTEVIQVGKALKLFYEVIFARKLNIKSTGEAKEIKLPDILTKAEVKEIIQQVSNFKHKCMLLLIYNSGLRISEAINLLSEDLDLENHTITLRDKDHHISRKLSVAANIIEFLTVYVKHKKKNESTLLFPGENDTPYSSRNVQLFFQSALKKTNIEKNATVHTLRHSFAVHALENGMDIHLLQQILGHKLLQNTSVYNQIAKIELHKLKSPMQDINLREGQINFFPY